jgi:hypothetical protein
MTAALAAAVFLSLAPMIASAHDNDAAGTPANTGCSRSAGWHQLRTGMTPYQVERALGLERVAIHHGHRMVWEYRACGGSRPGKVIFEKRKLLHWKTPQA